MALSSDPCKYFEMHQNISAKCCIPLSIFYLVHATLSDRFISITTDAFFHRNPKLLGLGRQFGQINFGVFWADLSESILVK